MAVSSPLSFDPRQVPVSRVDDDLPRVPHAHLRPEALRQRFASPPDWSPEVVREPRFGERAPAQAAVLIPIVLRDAGAGGPTILLTLRTAHLSTHSGQIAFPGGKVDAEDPSVQAAALREAHEEVGLSPERVQVIGELPIYVTGTSFLVTPVVGLVEPNFTLNPNPGEVADVFEVPLAFLMNPAHHRRHTVDWQSGRREWFSMPYTEHRLNGQGLIEPVERFIWGATAGMLRNFYRFLLAEHAASEVQ
ncbi:CoA pyrophosphatase [Limnohabitans radicicola]|uniref:CoA pyrophosphatase n=1 Tax=Limnohabitans radicicola TaxID=2771427 RepID=A0A927FEM7_9BURK|nr:CoA pyrophosphatase [Limnohabitans radicicola]MBD8049241.1 CoA pyrophosphatase [Limnohabitans radicicola]